MEDEAETSTEYFLDLHPICAECGERVTLVGDMFICDNGHPNFEDVDGSGNEFMYAYQM